MTRKEAWTWIADKIEEGLATDPTDYKSMPVYGVWCSGLCDILDAMYNVGEISYNVYCQMEAVITRLRMLNDYVPWLWPRNRAGWVERLKFCRSQADECCTA